MVGGIGYSTGLRLFGLEASENTILDMIAKLRLYGDIFVGRYTRMKFLGRLFICI